MLKQQSHNLSLISFAHLSNKNKQNIVCKIIREIHETIIWYILIKERNHRRKTRIGANGF